MHFNQISTYGWHVKGAVRDLSDESLWNIILRLFLYTISDEQYATKRLPNVDLKKLSKYNLVRSLLQSTNHRRLLIPKLIQLCENHDSRNGPWIKLLTNFRNSNLPHVRFYYNYQRKTKIIHLDGVIYLSVRMSTEFETEIFFAEKGKLELIDLE